MDIPELSMALSQTRMQNDFGVAMLSKSLDLSEQLGATIVNLMDTAAMEQSVTPHLGSNIDISV